LFIAILLSRRARGAWDVCANCIVVIMILCYGPNKPPNSARDATSYGNNMEREGWENVCVVCGSFSYK
jgi:hypothetical protein